ncbi:AraC-like DNA-binding protein [Pontibacter ummariensis]|uniref:AraC-type DNA-binding protein n=1 Tax=Pontibacter ummariensis TaxID=1610492 RepID=A0A239I6N3_9BACT|nr:AraC family transcriptional regulator [Pontibacter ummariensis]PRY10018.1 AraC-like DNA-binding protein [Pontibacter ummariensis]SNS89207.1 AraC-type DNA-binding protein [Pontibacter ummariensis]
MATTKLYIKNMVCDRCKRVVAEDLSKLGYKVLQVGLGEAEIATDETSEVDMEQIRQVMSEDGFELLDDRKTQLIEKVKLAIIALVHANHEAELHVNTSDYIAEKVGLDYNYLSTLFSSYEGVTIEKYLILQRIERVKELLVYNELSLKEIAYQLGYSSVAHLSSQFKKITGLTPSHFKQVKEEKRKTLDKVKD